MTLINPLAVPAPVHPAPATQVHREGRQHDLRVDQIIQATVAEGGLERVLLELGHRRFWAETRLPLQTGQKLQLLVAKTDPRTELRILADPLTERLGHSLHLLGAKWEILAVLRDLVHRRMPAPSGGTQANYLQETLEMFSAPGDNGSREWLGSFLQRLGLDYESLLAQGRGEGAAATLKGALLSYLTQEGVPEDLREEAERVLQNLELFQLCRIRLASQGTALWPLPFPFLEEGYLLAERRQPAQEEGESSSFRLSLNLSLQGLGDLKVDLLQDEQGLHLRLDCDGPEKAAFVAGFEKELREALEGHPLVGIAFGAGAESPSKALLRRIMPPGGDGLFNARV